MIGPRCSRKGQAQRGGVPRRGRRAAAAFGQQPGTEVATRLKPSGDRQQRGGQQDHQPERPPPVGSPRLHLLCPSRSARPRSAFRHPGRRSSAARRTPARTTEPSALAPREVEATCPASAPTPTATRPTPVIDAPVITEPVIPAPAGSSPPAADTTATPAPTAALNAGQHQPGRHRGGVQPEHPERSSSVRPTSSSCTPVARRRGTRCRRPGSGRRSSRSWSTPPRRGCSAPRPGR